MSAEHECQFPEEQEPSGRLILAPCLECGLSALDAIKELQNRLSTVEKQIKDDNEVFREGYKNGFDAGKENGLERLSTLLKASEGMEKALAHGQDDLEIVLSYMPEMLPAGMSIGKKIRMESIAESIRLAKQALADFRAVKE